MSRETAGLGTTDDTIAYHIRELAKSAGPATFDGMLIALDPGETMGCALFEGYQCLDMWHEDCTHAKDWADILQAILIGHNTTVVVEDYRIYSWRSKQHEWADVPTLRLIGGIEVYCGLVGYTVHKQIAQEGKSFWKDARLEKHVPPLYEKSKGKPHARDALRHALHWLVFKQPKL